MQIKITGRYPFTPTRLAGIKQIKTSVGEGAEKLKHTHCWWETVWEFFKTLNRVTTWPAILLPGISPREMKAHVHMKTISMFTAAYL